jgi:F-type H+-transporting ATPase subunit a
MNVDVTGAYVYFVIPIFGGIPVTQTMVSLLLVTVLLGCVGYHLGKNLQKRPGKLQVLTEKGVMILRDLVVSSMGEHNAYWTPYIGTIFLSSMFGSLIGLTGFLRSSTADLSVTLTWAVMTTVIIWYNSIKRNGFLGWLKGFTQPIFVMTPMNIISEIAQPVSMAFRHFGNVAGGGVISSILYAALSIASNLVLGLVSRSVAGPVIMLLLCVLLVYRGMKKSKKLPLIGGIALGVIGVFGFLEYFGILSGVPILQYGIPAVLSLYFDLFSGFVQAFVFSLLSMAYIAAACPPPETEENK